MNPLLRRAALAAMLLTPVLCRAQADGDERGCFKGPESDWVAAGAGPAEASNPGVKVKCEMSSGPLLWLSVSRDGTPLAELQADRSGPRSLKDLLGEMLKVPADRLRAVTAAHRDLTDDMKALGEELHVDAGFPSALPQNERYPENQKQLLQLYMKVCSGSSPQDAKLGMLAVPVSEYLPGRADYSPESIYRKGDLKRAFAADNALQAAYQGHAQAAATESSCQKALDQQREMQSYYRKRLDQNKKGLDGLGAGEKLP